MSDKIKDFLERIAFHQRQHQVTIFNKQKNTKNTISHNETQGKLIEQLRKFPYFNEQNQNLGTEYLLIVIKFIQPHILRKNNILINKDPEKVQNEYLLCEGVIGVYENDSLASENNSLKQSILSRQHSTRQLKFKQYITSGGVVSFSKYPQSVYHLLAHQNSKLLRLPTRNQLDPIKYYQKVLQVNQSFTKNPSFNTIKNKLNKLYQQLSKHNQNYLDSMFGLGQLDNNQLLSQAVIKIHQAHHKICHLKSQVKFIGLLVNGQVIAEDIKHRNKKIVTHDHGLLECYKNNYSQDKNKLEKNQILLEQGHWLGIDEYLQHLHINPFRLENILDKSSKQLQNQSLKELQFFYQKQYRAKQDCEILWIPILSFAKKINYQTTFSSLTKWVSLINLKLQIKQKNYNIHEKLEAKNNQNPQLSNPQFPKLQQKLQKLSHHSGLETITELRSKIIGEKRKKNPHHSLKQPIKISQNSLLGITIQNRHKFETTYQKNDLSIQLPRFKGFSHSFRSPKQGLKNKKQNQGLNQGGKTQRVNNSFSERKIDVSAANEKDEIQGLIMYPDAYEPKKLSPDLRKQMFYAQKTWRLSNLNSNKKKNPLCDIDRQRGISLTSQGIDNLATNRLSSMGSRQSLHSSMLSTPQSLYKNLMQKISFKYPDLQQKLRIQKFIKKRNQMMQQVKIKQRIQTLKVLGDIERKRRVRQSRQRKNGMIVDENVDGINTQKQHSLFSMYQSQYVAIEK